MNNCFVCGKEIVKPSGYGVDTNGNKVCYPCCAEQDKQYMRDHGRITLYLTMDGQGKYKVTNWPGSVIFSASCVKRSSHNIARYRYDTWFVFEGYYWHAVQYGDNTQIAHCKRTKSLAK